MGLGASGGVGGGDAAELRTPRREPAAPGERKQLRERAEAAEASSEYQRNLKRAALRRAQDAEGKAAYHKNVAASRPSARVRASDDAELKVDDRS